ncbi:IS200/IS605 family transposase [Wolbachia endosymbiont of Frankliniella intonsa]|uniref:IS200/IS605 family transposase n=1 Tax=Wolbachia endosymbiont of Frankliniella intonsa TaxID=2902422 RepID=UPI00244ECD71|nr:IS200/IS605 family transposase [Wolbachia endosymbiont of Frankliniella intonsa]WGJ61833.1 IS200/IS605 family transposase [Wolbachia endosymbiont of Frankliniella intonsa]
MPFIPRYFTYSSMTFSPLFSICSFYSGNWYKYDMRVHLVWIPKYRKRVIIGQIAVRVRELLRQVTMENEIQIISGKVAVDHIHMFISYKPQQSVSKIVQLLKGTSSRLMMQDFASLSKQFWGRHLWARGY